MALKKFTENPRTTDKILLEIETTDASGCLDTPYKLDSATIYYVERDFLGSNWGEYDYQVEDKDLKADLQEAIAAACADPSAENLLEVERLQQELTSSTTSIAFYYKDRRAIEVIGTPSYPAWLSTDVENSQFEQATDEDDNLIEGTFQFEWTPNGSIREGTYFLCWSWTPNPAGEKLSAHMPFSVLGDPKAVTTIPTHVTPEGKYETLLERYLPEMYKQFISDGDLTPASTLALNQATADGFTVLEDYANQIIDLFDANALHESLLMYLSNLFCLKLKSGDPTLWRRQIKEAIPLFKKKGTLDALESAFAQSGMVLNSFTQYWQLTSPYTWQESFKVADSAIFVLGKSEIILPIDESNFGLWLRRGDEDEYVAYSKDYVTFELDEDCENSVTMTWVGDELSANPVSLFEGDFIRVLYKYKEIPTVADQLLENYIRALPLMDLRDEADQAYPPKNWNVRLIDEQDPLFPVLVPVKHPFHDPLVFGFVRTEFAYSENIYNMEEYNGSTRPSFDACNIDKSFIDPCGACLGSAYSVDIGVEELCNDRMLEAQDILREYMPFHASLHSISFTGEVSEFVQQPTEFIDFLVTISRIDNHLSGQANSFFNRGMEGGLSNWIIDREDLADKTTVLSGKLGNAYNGYVAITTPDVILADLGILTYNHILEVLAPSANAGTYTIRDIQGRTANIGSTAIEPVDESQFTFNLSNIPYSNSTTTIEQDDYLQFTDEGVLFEDLGVKTLWDVDNTPDYTGGSWKISIPAYSATPYEITDIVNGALILVYDGTLPTVDTEALTYSLLDDNDTEIMTSDEGVLAVERRAFVSFNDTALEIHDFVKLGDFMFYDNVEYEIIKFLDQDFWIRDWEDGDLSGEAVDIRRRLVDAGTGQFGYRELHLTTFSDHETEFDIQDGSNPPTVLTDDNNFKENYMFRIGDEFFRIVEWDGQEVTLAGRDQVWMTADAGGTTVAYSLVHFPKKEVNVQFTVFSHLDRDGHDPIIRTIEDPIGNLAIVALSSGGAGMEEYVGQEEGVSFVIESRFGDTEEGEI